MITENRWKHILGVARKAKEFALKMRPKDKKYVEDMFLLGLLHDIGYEFTEGNASHAIIGSEIYQYWREVAKHGDETVANMSDELFILHSADMMTGPGGKEFAFVERLEEIAKRFLEKNCNL